LLLAFFGNRSAWEHVDGKVLSTASGEDKIADENVVGEHRSRAIWIHDVRSLKRGLRDLAVAADRAATAEIPLTVGREDAYACQLNLGSMNSLCLHAVQFLFWQVFGIQTVAGTAVLLQIR
jgi:hypothetical protein